MMNRRNLVLGALASLIPLPASSADFTRAQLYRGERILLPPGRPSVYIDLHVETDELGSLFEELGCLFDRMPRAVKDEILLRFDLPNKIGDLFRIQPVTLAAARELRVSFEPTERLIELLATCRASQGYQNIVFDDSGHTESSVKGEWVALPA